MQNDGVKNQKSSNLDKVGIICSGACVLHCMSAPLLALASPVIVSFFENEWIHLLCFSFNRPDGNNCILLGLSLS